MKIFVLISTIDRRVLRVSDVLQPLAQDVHYVVVWQHSQDLDWTDVDISDMEARADVTLVTMPGKGLSRSRNLAMKTAVDLLEDSQEDAIFVIADDDVQFKKDAFGLINVFYLQHAEVDVALMRMRSVHDRHYFKKYPDKLTDYRKRPRSYYPASWEMTFRARVWQAGIRFDTRFGLGAEKLCAGEEDIFLADAVDCGLQVMIVPIDIGYTRPLSTGAHDWDTKVLRSRGAVYGYTRSLPGAFLRTLREAMSLSIRQRTHFIPLFRKIWYGVKYIRQ